MPSIYDSYCFEHRGNYLKDYCPDCRINQLQARLDAVIPYVQHKPSCHKWRFNNVDKCSCGLEQALEQKEND